MSRLAVASVCLFCFHLFLSCVTDFALLLTGVWLCRSLRFPLGLSLGLRSAFVLYHVSSFWLAVASVPHLSVPRVFRSAFGLGLHVGFQYLIAQVWVAIA
jgi:hypothetical protein